MKKLFAVILTFVFLFSAASLAFAEIGAPRVSAQSVAVRAGEQVTIPFVIENNPGIMGFGFVITYDPAVLKPLKTARGDMLSGLFDDNLDAGNTGRLKVLFAGNDDIKSNGTLFTVTFSVLSLEEAEYRAQMRCVQGDTFNAKWEDVALACDEIVFRNAAMTSPSASDSSSPSAPTGESSSSVESSSETSDSGSSTGSNPTDPQPEPPAREKLSVRIRNWAAGLRKPFNVIMKILTAPVVLIVSLFE